MLFYFINKKASLFLLLAAKECEGTRREGVLVIKKGSGFQN